MVLFSRMLLEMKRNGMECWTTCAGNEALADVGCSRRPRFARGLVRTARVCMGVLPRKIHFFAARVIGKRYDNDVMFGSFHDKKDSRKKIIHTWATM